MKKKVSMIGGNGLIGSILSEHLQDKYELVVLDKQVPEKENYIQVNATKFEELIQKIPRNSDVLVNLLNIHTKHDLEDIEAFSNMIEIHFISSFYILHAAKILGIQKVVYASSNHVTDYYEKEGTSLLGREINIHDYPFSRGLYGTLKLASENIGRIFAMEGDLSVINLRIGSVPKDELLDLGVKSRIHKTLLSRNDVVQLFDLAIQSSVKYGTYYGVSDNPNKPWSTENVTQELGFTSQSNSRSVLEKAKKG